MTLKILPHGRLQEWVAEEQGYFAAEGLEYSLGSLGPAGSGAFETRGRARRRRISCACLLGPAGRQGAVPRPIRSRAIWSGPGPGAAGAGGLPLRQHSPPCRPEAVLDGALTFGPPNDGSTRCWTARSAATLFGVPLYIAEAFGFRKVLDATFMIGFLVTGPDVTQADVGKYLAALRRAQMDIDLHPESFKHHHLRAVPEKYRHRSTCAPSAPVSASSSCPTPGKSSPPPRPGPAASSPPSPNPPPTTRPS